MIVTWTSKGKKGDPTVFALYSEGTLNNLRHHWHKPTDPILKQPILGGTMLQPSGVEPELLSRLWEWPDVN